MPQAVPPVRKKGGKGGTPGAVRCGEGGEYAAVAGLSLGSRVFEALGEDTMRPDREKRYLKDCLNSLNEENLSDIEIILIINGNQEDINDLLKNHDNLNIGFRKS